MKKITDDDLTLLYYGEHDDPSLAASVAESPELSARYDALCQELQLADAYVPPQRSDEYGSEVWQHIAPQLDDASGQHPGRFKTFLSSFAQPRFSVAGALSMMVVVVLALTLGRNGSQENIPATGNPAGHAALAQVEIDSQRLLSYSVSTHLDEVNLVLTQFANSAEPDPNEAGYATDMLVANRLYRQAAVAQGDHKLAAFLAELEPLLIEMAYQAQSGSPATRKRMQREVKDGLLFRIRVMNRKLNKTEISV